MICKNIDPTYGGGILVKYCTVTLENNTIVGNKCENDFSPDMCHGGGICTGGNGIIIGQNNIIYFNTCIHDPEWSTNGHGGGQIMLNYTCTSQELAGLGNIIDDPIFVDTLSCDFHLQQESPCIDAGDPNSPLDPDGTRADMGALYYDQGVGVENIQYSILNFQLRNYPNPFNPETTISFSVTQTSPFVTLEIFNLKGQKVKTLINAIIPKGFHRTVWNGTDENGKPVSSGIYFYKMKTGKYVSTKRMILLQ